MLMPVKPSYSKARYGNVQSYGFSSVNVAGNCLFVTSRGSGPNCCLNASLRECAGSVEMSKTCSITNMGRTEGTRVLSLLPPLLVDHVAWTMCVVCLPAVLNLPGLHALVHTSSLVPSTSHPHGLETSPRWSRLPKPGRQSKQQKESLRTTLTTMARSSHNKRKQQLTSSTCTQGTIVPVAYSLCVSKHTFSGALAL